MAYADVPRGGDFVFLSISVSASAWWAQQSGVKLDHAAAFGESKKGVAWSWSRERKHPTIGLKIEAYGGVDVVVALNACPRRYGQPLALGSVFQ